MSAPGQQPEWRIADPAILQLAPFPACKIKGRAEINPTGFTPCDTPRIFHTGGSGTKADSVGDAV